MIFRCKLYETTYLLEMNSSLFNNVSNIIDLAICCLWSRGERMRFMKGKGKGKGPPQEYSF